MVLGFSGVSLRAQSALDGFDPEVTGSVNALAVFSLHAGAYAGKIMVGGSFSQLQPHLLVSYYPASGLARLNEDGSVDTGFAIPSLVNPTNPALPAQVTKLIALDNGQVVVGGDFEVKGTTSAYLVRFNPDGSIDSTFAPTLTGDVDGAVTALYTQKTDGSTPLYVGGNFTKVTWNGATVTGSTASRGHLVRFTPAGALDTTWVPDADAQVDAIGIQLDSNNNPLWVIIGGAFQNVQSSNFTYLARLSPVTAAVDTSYNPWPNAQVTSLVVESTGNVIIGGWFTELDPLQPNGSYPATSVAAGYVARILTNGTQDTTFDVTAANDVQDIILEDNGEIVLVGDLGEVTSSTAASIGLYIARLYPTGEPDGTFLPSFDATTFAVAEMPNGQLVVGGIFASAHSGHSLDAVPRKALARLNADGTLDVDFNPNAYGGFGAIYVESDGSYLVGGSFQSIGNVTIRNLAHILQNGQVDTSFEPNPDGPVSAITIDSNNMIVIGGFFQNPVPVGPPPTYTPETTPITFLARMDKQGNLDTSFNPNPSENVTAIIPTGSGASQQYIVAGGFNIWADGVGGQNNSAITPVVDEFLARINNDGSVDQTFMPQPNGQVNAIVIDSTGKYLIAGGLYTALTPNSTGIKTVTSTTEAGLARINLTNGTIDTTWNPNSLASVTTEGPINALALTANGEILVGGTFTGLVPGNSPVDPVSLAPIPTMQGFLALIQANGDLDTSFKPQLDGPVYGLAISPVTKKIYIGGVFQNVDDVYQPWLARLNPDGSIDKNPSAVTGFGATLNGPATVIVPVGGSADQMLVGGAFTTVTPFGSTTQVQEGHLVLFNPDGSIDTSFAVAASVSGTVNAIALADNGLLYLGGSFSNIGGTYASNLARFWNDGTAETSYGADPRGGSGVNTLIVESDGNSIYVGGSFTAIGTSDSTTSSSGTPITPINVANFVRTNNDGSLDPTFVPPNINGTVYAA
ncbi:MAG TPA: delta-60 repeat domain-containing protein, partial [Opitutaceae bacterium]|nr:delta-60 repeat domain-containing protein [Opitutaceae bacterium]